MNTLHQFPPCTSTPYSSAAAIPRMPSPRHYSLNRAAQPRPYTAVNVAPAHHPAELPDTFVADGQRLLGSDAAPVASHARYGRPATPERSRLTEAAVRWREGSLEDWEYWQHHGEKFKRVTVGVILSSLLTLIGYGTYWLVDRVVLHEKPTP